MEVINRTNGAIQQHQHAKFSTLDFDLWAESQHLINGLSPSISVHHIKSHQDDTTDMDDLTTEAYRNVMMDRKAERHRERNPHNIQPYFMRTSKVALRINNTLIVGLVKKALIRKCPG